MSHREKAILASLISSVLVFAGFCAVVLLMYQQGRFTGPDAATVMGRAILALVAAGIVANIATTIMLSCVLAGAGDETGARAAPDERDQLIELKGMQAFLVCFIFAFFAAILALAFGAAAALVFFLIVLALFLGSVTDDATKLFFYRRGF